VSATIIWNDDDLHDVVHSAGRQIAGEPGGEMPDRYYFVDRVTRSSKWRSSVMDADRRLHKIGHRLWPTYQEAMQACEEYEAQRVTA
jgi:hypothetical protein